MKPGEIKETWNRIARLEEDLKVIEEAKRPPENEEIAGTAEMSVE